jgi:hypothetical protein
MSDEFMKKPCAHCPFRRDVRPFLHPERAEEIAYSAQNPYAEFICHKTLGHDEEEGDTIVVETSLICAGFLAMQINEAGLDEPEDWTWPDNVYADLYEMIDAYAEEWERAANARRAHKART